MTEQKQKNEYETVTIQVPKPVMAFLRFQAKQENFDPVEKLIEYDLIDNVRAEFEGINGEELIAMFNLGHIFWEVLGDDRYKPKDVEPEAESGKIAVFLDKETIEFAEKHNIDINEAAKQYLEKLKAKYGN